VRELARLADAIEGEVIVPDSPDYEAVPPPAFAQYAAVRPELVVRCKTPHDVAEAIAFARRHELRRTTRAGGHCFAGRSSTEGLLIDVSLMSEVFLSGDIATIGAGARLGEVYDRLEPEGRTIAAGACPSVGIAGLTLGGGLGIIGRTYGLTCDQLLEAEIVLADGSTVVCNREVHEDLFWALRGAGAEGFGVVTRFEFRTVPAHHLTCFLLRWPYAHAASLVAAWQSWSPQASEELAASLLLNAPAELEQEPFVTLFGAMMAGEAETRVAVDELILWAGADPSSSTFEHVSSGAAKRYLAEHAPGSEESNSAPTPFMFSKSEFFRDELPGEAIAALVEHFARDRDPGAARELDFTPWGGAYNRPDPASTAFVHRNERFLLKHAVVLDASIDSGQQESARTWLQQSWALVHPWGSGGVFPNFADLYLTYPGIAYFGSNRDRVEQIKAEHAP
jgi:hypothetical protein